MSAFDARIDHDPRFKHLGPWLDVATAGLSDQACARVLEEIGAHFEDAVAAAMQRGLDEGEAAQRAVKALGSPRRARRRLRRTYLTRNQARIVDHLIGSPRATFLLQGMVTLFVAATILLDTRRTTVDYRLRLALVALMAVACVVRGTAVPRLFRDGRQRTAVALGGLTEFLLWTAFVIAGSSGLTVQLWVVALFFTAIVVSYLPLAAKLEDRRPHRAA